MEDEAECFLPAVSCLIVSEKLKSILLLPASSLNWVFQVSFCVCRDERNNNSDTEITVFRGAH